MHPQGKLSHLLNAPKLPTLLVSQASSELKAVALANVLNMLVTALVSQTSGWLKERAPEKVETIDVTLLVSQASSELNAWAF